jgi:hypothetical protein
VRDRTAFLVTELARVARAGGLAALVFLCCQQAFAETTTITLPAAASIQGVAPFYSDVRVFNISYTDTLTVTATYRCYIGNPCPHFAANTIFVLPPRSSRSFDDMVGTTFTAPNTAGGIEFEVEGPGGDDADALEQKESAMERLVVSSRLYSTFPKPTVGMLIPGLPISEAFRDAVLTSVLNGGAGAGFRTNAGVFNPNDQPVDVRFQLLDGSAPVGEPVEATIGAHSGLQVNRIFAQAGEATLETASGSIMVNATGKVFAWAAIIDNNTSDPYLVSGTEDLPPQPFHPPTRTPTRTRTRTPVAPAPTETGTPVPPPPTATFTPTIPPATATRTPTGPPATSTRTPTGPPATATRTPTGAPATATQTPTSPPATATATRTPTPPPQTSTPTSTPTQAPATSTPTRTPTAPPPTATSTGAPPPPTATRTNTPQPPPPTATPTGTFTPPPATATPTRTSTPVPPTATSTATQTPVPSTATPTRTPTPPPPTSTPTRTPTSVPPTPTPTPPSAPITVTLVATQFQWSFNGGGPDFTFTAGQPYHLLVSDGDPPGSPDHGFGGVSELGLASHRLVAGDPPIVYDFTPTSGQAGTYDYKCNVSSCGNGHDNMDGNMTVAP